MMADADSITAGISDEYARELEVAARLAREAGAVIKREGNPLPSSRESMATAFFGERLAKRYSQFTGGKKKDSWIYKQ